MICASRGPAFGLRPAKRHCGGERMAAAPA